MKEDFNKTLKDYLSFFITRSNASNISPKFFSSFATMKCLFCSLNKFDVLHMFHYLVPFQHVQFSFKIIMMSAYFIFTGHFQSRLVSDRSVLVLESQNHRIVWVGGDLHRSNHLHLGQQVKVWARCCLSERTVSNDRIIKCKTLTVWKY